MVETKQAEGATRRVIKRYSNRKLYDTKDSRYVTLLQIAEMMRGGEEVQIIDNNSKEDLTEVTLAQIIYEEQKQSTSRAVPLQTLKDIIHQRTEKVLTELRGGPIGRLIPGSKSEPPPPLTSEGATAKTDGGGQRDGKSERPGLVDQAKGTLEDWQQKIDDRVRALLPTLLPWQQLTHELKRLTARVEELEEKLRKASRDGGDTDGHA